MPLVDQQEVMEAVMPNLTFRQTEQTQPEQTQPDRPRPSVGETFYAAFQLDNTIASALNEKTNAPGPISGVSLAFNPLPFLNDDDDPRDYLYAKSEEDVYRTRTALEYRREYEQTTDDAGLFGVGARFVASVVDWPTFLPAAGFYRGATKGTSVLGTTAYFAGSGFVGTAAQEMALTSTAAQPQSEAKANIMAGTVLSGILGGSVGAYKALKDTPQMTTTFDDLARVMDEDVNRPMNASQMPFGSKDAGAAGAPRASSDELTPTSSLGIGYAASRLPTFGDDASKFDIFNTPDIRILYTKEEIAASKDAVMRLVGTALELKGHKDGSYTSPIPVQNKIETAMQEFALPIKQSLQEAMVELKKDPSIKMGEHEFNSRVYMAVRNGVEREPNPIIRAEAAKVRDKFKSQEPIFEELGKGYLKFDDGRAYIPQVPNIEAISKSPFDFQRLVEQQFFRQRDEIIDTDVIEKRAVADLNKRIKELEKARKAQGKSFDAAEELAELRRLKKEGKKAIQKSQFANNLLDEEIRTAAARLVQKLEGMPDTRDIHDAAAQLFAREAGQGQAGSLRQRRLDWDDDIFEALVAKGYIETDVETVVNVYSRSVIPDLQMAREFGTVDARTIANQAVDADITPKLDAIDARMQAVKSGADTSTTVKKLQAERRKLLKLSNQLRSDIEAIARRLTNRISTRPNTAQGRKFMQAVRNFNTLRAMGGVTLSSIPDLPRLMLIDASAPVMGAALGKMVKNLAPGEGRTAYLRQMQSFGVAANGARSSRGMKLAEVADDIYLGNKKGFYENFNDFTSNFFNHNGMNWWNDTVQAGAAAAISSEIAHVSNKILSGPLSQADAKKLRRLGITEDNAKTIAEQIKKHGERDGALVYPGLEDWDISDKRIAEAYEAYRGAVQKEVRIIVIEPTAGERPVMMDEEFGKSVLQFKSFGYASLQKSTILYAQRLAQDPLSFRTYTALMGQVALGGVVTAIKLVGNPKLLAAAGGWSAAQWAAEAVDRSGVVASVTDGYNIANTLTGIPDIARAEIEEGLGVEADVGTTTRYQVRNPLDRVAGPTYGLAYDIGKSVSGAANFVAGNDITQSEIDAMHRLLPYRNLPGLRELLGIGKEQLFEDLDIPKSR